MDLAKDKTKMEGKGYGLLVEVGLRHHKVEPHANLKGCPHDDLDPLMACIDVQRRGKVSRQRSQHRVLLYIWSHFEDSMEASLLIVEGSCFDH